MAGVVAGLGAISQAALLNKNLKEDKAERDALRAEQKAINEKNASMFESMNENWKTIQERLEGTLVDVDESPSTPTSSETNNSGSSTTQSQPAASTPALSSPPSGTSGWQKLSKVIRYGEGTTGQAGYNTQFTGTKFNDMSRRPGS